MPMTTGCRFGDNYFTPEQFDEAARAPIDTPLDDPVVGVTLEQIRRARARRAVAGGKDEHAILRAALVGGWVDHLVTDTATAGHLLEARPRRA